MQTEIFLGQPTFPHYLVWYESKILQFTTREREGWVSNKALPFRRCWAHELEIPRMTVVLSGREYRVLDGEECGRRQEKRGLAHGLGRQRLYTGRTGQRGKQGALFIRRNGKLCQLLKLRYCSRTIGIAEQHGL